MVSQFDIELEALRREIYQEIATFRQETQFVTDNAHMSVSYVNPPPQFHHAHDSWSSWKRRFLNFCCANCINYELRGATLVNFLSPASFEYVLFHNLFPERLPDLSQVTNKLDALFLDNVTKARQRLLSIRQRPDQSIASFSEDLRALLLQAHETNTALREDLGLQIVVTGLYDSAMRERLLVFPPDTFEKAVQLAIRIDNAYRDTSVNKYNLPEVSTRPYFFHRKEVTQSESVFVDSRPPEFNFFLSGRKDCAQRLKHLADNGVISHLSAWKQYTGTSVQSTDVTQSGSEDKNNRSKVHTTQLLGPLLYQSAVGTIFPVEETTDELQPREIQVKKPNVLKTQPTRFHDRSDVQIYVSRIQQDVIHDTSTHAVDDIPKPNRSDRLHSSAFCRTTPLLFQHPFEKASNLIHFPVLKELVLCSHVDTPPPIHPKVPNSRRVKETSFRYRGI